MADGEPTEDHYHVARVTSDVWLSNRRASAIAISKRLNLAMHLLIGD